jgi:hypothetical protein
VELGHPAAPGDVQLAAPGGVAAEPDPHADVELGQPAAPGDAQLAAPGGVAAAPHPHADVEAALAAVLHEEKHRAFSVNSELKVKAITADSGRERQAIWMNLIKLMPMDSLLSS